MTTDLDRQLAQLAAYFGVETSYYTIEGKLQQATAQGLLTALRALGAPLATMADVPAACAALMNGALTEPDCVRIVWGEAPVSFTLPDAESTELWLESGER